MYNVEECGRKEIKKEKELEKNVKEKKKKHGKNKRKKGRREMKLLRGPNGELLQLVSQWA